MEEEKLPITKTSSAWGGMNSSSILEPFVRLYVLTGLRRYLDFAKYIIENGGIECFDLFRAAEEDRLFPFEYPVTKAYEMMSCFEGLLWYYRVVGEKKYLEAAERFVARIMQPILRLSDLPAVRTSYSIIRRSISLILCLAASCRKLVLRLRG